MVFEILLAVAEILGMFTVGAIARITGRINDQDIDRWSKLILDFLLPAFIFNSIINSFQIERLNELWPLPLLGLGLVVYGTIGGILLRFGLCSTDKRDHRSFIHFCAVNNSTYLPIVIVRNIFGETTLANLFFFNFGTIIGIWTIGIAILGAGNLKTGIRNVLTPNLVSIIAAFALVITGTHLFIPPLVNNIIRQTGSAAVPLMLILIGATLTSREAFRISWPVIYISIVRLIILPAVAIFTLSLLPISSEVYSIAVIVALMPVAVSSAITFRRYGGNPGYAASTALVTTILSILTVPAALLILFGK